MKRRGGFIAIIFFLYAASSNGGWQVVQSKTNEPKDPFYQADVQQQKIFPTKLSPVPVADTRKYATPKITQDPIFEKDNPITTNASEHSEQPDGLYAITMSGSVKQNLERIMGRYEWKVVWKAPYDFNFDGHVSGSSLPNVIEKLLKPFPLKAVMFMSNRTLEVVPRSRT